MNNKYTFEDLLNIMSKLRGQDGCPWDRVQTQDSLKKYIIEEAYEVVDAIEGGSKDKHCEELGDVLLQIVFQTQIAKEHNHFDIRDVTNSICTKLINRHPHIFGQDTITEARQVEEKWQEIKSQEKGLTTYTQVMNDIPKSFPALLRSYKVQKKAAEVGFDWDDVDDAISKIYEELNELKEVYKGSDQEKITEELGDLLFAVVNVSRMLDVEPETALNSTIKKFIKRFEYIEQNKHVYKKELKDMTLEEMDNLWNEAKHNL